MAKTDQDSPSRADREAPLSLRSWALTIALCLVFSTIGAFWLKWATFPNIAAALCEAIPPIPALAALLFLVGLRFLLGPVGRRFGLTTAQIVAVYCFVSVSVSIGFINLYRKVLSRLGTPLYVVDPAMEKIAEYLPSWLAPTNEVILEQFWNGGVDTPWEHWIYPMLTIGGLFLGFYLVVICMLRLFYKRWSQEERLTYPVAEFALSLVEQDGRRREEGSIFARPIFWWGCGLALVFNLFYIVPALTETMPLPPTWINAAAYFPDHPWNAMGQWQIRLNPIIFGLGYLVSLDVLLSIWVSFLFIKAQAVFMAARGIPRNTVFGLGQQQGIGAYVALTVFMVYAARRHLWAALKRVLPGTKKSDDPMDAGRWTVLFLLVGVAGLLILMSRVGMSLWLAGAFLGMLLIRSLVMSRIRAQAGMPNIYFHVGSVRDLVWIVGGAALAGAGMPGVAALVFLGFMTGMTYLAPHHADAFKLAERSKLGTRRWAVLAVLAVFVGLILANLTHLPAAHRYGALNVSAMAPSTWGMLDPINAANRGTSPDWTRLSVAGEGAVITGILTYLRRFYWFPLHPVGYVVACAIGYRVFAPVFAIWAIKWVILHYFGGSIHRKARRLFLGLVLGHFAVAALWAVLAVFRWPPTERYFIGFW